MLSLYWGGIGVCEIHSRAVPISYYMGPWLSMGYGEGTWGYDLGGGFVTGRPSLQGDGESTSPLLGIGMVEQQVR